MDIYYHVNTKEEKPKRKIRKFLIPETGEEKDEMFKQLVKTYIYTRDVLIDS